MGVGMKSLPNIINAKDMRRYVDLFEHKMYLILPDVQNHVIYVVFRKGETPEDVLEAYFHSVILGIALCHYNNISLVINFIIHTFLDTILIHSLKFLT